jgi:predicted negative regulator of RcsB-dependent stress response
MAILTTDDRNIVEADALNWRYIVYPIVAIVVILLGGFGIYYYQLNQREVEETQARDALVQAKTPQAMVKVADQYPKTTQAAIALMSAADASFTTKDYSGAAQDYQRVASTKGTPSELRDSARLGLGASLAADGKSDDAIRAYLEVAQKRNHSAFSPAAYYAVAQIYAGRKDKDNEQRILQQTVQLGSDSPFVKEAAAQLKALAPAPSIDMLGGSPANATSAATNAAPAPTAPAKASP